MATLLTSAATCAGRYRLGSVIGRGPFGVVLSATDLQLDAPCYLKMLDFKMDRSLSDLVIADAERAAQIGPPGILAPYSMGLDQLDHVYLACPARGDLCSLRARLAEGTLTPEETLGLLTRAVAALSAAGGIGLHHGDLKPSNLFLGETCVSDYGMHRLIASGLPVAEGYGYLPPEFFTEDSTAPSARGDVFALGAILYECLSGHMLFPAKTASEAMQRVTASVLVPPVQLPDWYQGVLSVVRLACARDPHERFADARAFLRALTAAVSEIAVLQKASRSTAHDLRPPQILRSRPEFKKATEESADLETLPKPETIVAAPKSTGRQTSIYAPPNLAIGKKSDGTTASAAQPVHVDSARKTAAWVPLQEPKAGTPFGAVPQLSSVGKSPLPSVVVEPPSVPPLMRPPAIPEAATAPPALADVPTASIGLPASRVHRRPRRDVITAQLERANRWFSSLRLRRAGLYGGLGALTVLVFGSAWYVATTPPRPIPMPAATLPAQKKSTKPKPDEEMRGAFEKLAEKEYASALSLADSALANEPDNKVAKEVRRQALSGLRITSVVEGINQAKERGDADAVVTLYRQLPDGGEERRAARSVLTDVYKTFADTHLQLAGAAQRGRLCDVVESEVRRVQFVLEEVAPNDEERTKEARRVLGKCFERASRKDKSEKPAKSDKSKAESAEESKQDVGHAIF